MPATAITQSARSQVGQRGREAVEPGDAGVLVHRHLRAEQLGADARLVHRRAVRGARRDDHDVPARAAAARARSRRSARARAPASRRRRAATAARTSASARVTRMLPAPPSSSARDDLRDLLGRLALGEHRLGRALAQLAVRVDAREAEVADMEAARAARARPRRRAGPPRRPRAAARRRRSAPFAGTSSFAGEGRWPLLDERLDALAEVRRAAQQAVRESLDLEADMQRPLVAQVEHALRHAQRQRRALRQLVDQALDRRVEIVRLDDLRDESERERLLCADRDGRASRCPWRGRARSSAPGAGCRPSPGSSRSSPRAARAGRRSRRRGSRTRARARSPRRRRTPGARRHELRAALGRRDVARELRDLPGRGAARKPAMSPPAVNAPPAPASTTKPTESSASSSAKSPASCPRAAIDTRLYLPGTSSVIVATPASLVAFDPKAVVVGHTCSLCLGSSANAPSSSLITRRRIFPDALLGSVSTNRYSRGRLKRASGEARQWRSSSSAVAVADDHGDDALPPALVGHADHGDLRDARVAREHVLDLERMDVLAARDDHVVDPAVDPEVAVLVEVAGVARAVPAVARSPSRRRRDGSSSPRRPRRRRGGCRSRRPRSSRMRVLTRGTSGAARLARAARSRSCTCRSRSTRSG